MDFAGGGSGVYKEDLFPPIKVLLLDPQVKNKILFGSDYYMVEQEESEKEFIVKLRAALGESDFKRIAEDDIKLFLFTGQ
ncbi:MAG: hypothetical protein JST26_12135 [Bacteroidetes bacterium]|nr:hypothetical protein [Bacteroidota bacterium]